MRPPPGGTPAHNFGASPPQIAKITTRLCGIMNGRTLSGATAGAGGIAAGGGGTAASGAFAGCAAVAGADVVAATAALQGGDSAAALRCRQCNASAPPGWTPLQSAMKSERQDWRMASV